ncbi:unnamed protein product, partial [Rotaria sp. Silwood1]
IPMEILDCTRPNEICMLYYISPTRFYVYLKEKFDSHTSFQIDLQKSIQNLHTLSSPVKYQAIAVQDKRALWHRAIILDMIEKGTFLFHSLLFFFGKEVAPNLLNVCVYFFDIGHIECITINNIHQLPHEFRSKPAFAIPCCLYNVCPINEVGDLSAFLINNNLVSHATMSYSPRSNFSSDQPPQQSLVRPQFLSYGIPPSRERQQHEFYDNQNTIVQQLQTRTFNTGFQNTTAQQSSNTLSSISSSLTIGTVPPDDGYYIITQIRSAVEFYGLSQDHQLEFGVLSKELERYYNNSVNNQSLTVPVILDDISFFVIFFLIIHRENGSKVLVKLIDSGDEIVVNTSELLQIDKKFCTIPALFKHFIYMVMMNRKIR